MNMRRKDDKRVLRPGNKPPKKRSILSRGGNRSSRSNWNRLNDRNRFNGRNPPKPRNKKMVLFMIMALVAFIIGAGVGVSLTFENEQPEVHVENVTVEMTTNLTNDTDIVYDEQTDAVDYNNPESLEQYNNTVGEGYTNQGYADEYY